VSIFPSSCCQHLLVNIWSSNKIQNGEVLVPANSRSVWKMAVKMERIKGKILQLFYAVLSTTGCAPSFVLVNSYVRFCLVLFIKFSHLLYHLCLILYTS